MCTGFIRKGKDTIIGYNLDLDPAVWNYDIYKTKKYFSIGIKIGSTTYFTHGVNNVGQFSCLPYMNDDKPVTKGKNSYRIDLLTDRYIRNKLDYKAVKELLDNKTMINIPNGNLHTLLADKEHPALIIEPGLGYQEINEDYAVITNYPLLKDVYDDNPFYGKERYQKALEILKNSNEDFNAENGLKLLEEVRQTGQWGTRVSFVYSSNSNCVYYVLNNDFSNVFMHQLL